MAELVQMGLFITASERRAAEELRKLPDQWVVVCNKELVSPAGTVYEVDFIVVGDHAVLAIDEKSWAGQIRGNENLWVLPSGECRPSPLQKIGHVARQFAGQLRGRVPLLHELPPGEHFVEGLILLTAADVDLRVSDVRVQRQVVRLDEALERLVEQDRSKSRINLGAARMQIRRVLTDFPSRPKVPRQVNAYDIVEMLPAGRGFRAFRAKHRSGTERILKLYEVDPVQQPRESVLREYYGVRAASVAGVAPGVDPFFFWNEDRYIAIPFHLPEGSPLRKPAGRPEGGRPGYALQLMKVCFCGLKSLHQSGITHRALNPDRVHVAGSAGQQRVQFSDFMVCHMDARRTVAAEADEIEKDDPFLSPECRIGFGLADERTDVYGLGLSIAAHLCGEDPGREDAESGRVAEWARVAVGVVVQSWPAETAGGFAETLRQCCLEEPHERPTVMQVVERIEALLERWKEAGRSMSEPETLGKGRYKVIRKLGEGATAVAWLAEDTVYREQFVLKRIKNEALVEQLAGAEFRALKDLAHRCLPRVYDVGLPAEDFHVKLQYIPGDTLEARKEEIRGRQERACEVGTALLEVLCYLDEHGVLHRDISPKNILIPDDPGRPVCLIDFGLAKRREEARSSGVGTPLYRAPEVIGSGWSASADVYAVAVVLYEALTGHLPYVCADGVPQKDRPVNLPAELELEFPAAVLACLRKGASLRPEERYSSASEFLEAFQAAFGAREPEGVEPGQEVELLWVTNLAGLYRNSAVGNADNRGLESEFARKTYVETLLDQRLLPEIVAGQKRLVVLTGNPGDGKTAFFEVVWGALQKMGEVEGSRDRYGWRAVREGRRYEAIYDASESRGETSADQVLSAALRPFAGGSAPEPSGGLTLLIAINDGRLLDFLESARQEYGWLRGELLGAFFSGEGPEDPRLVLVDLKRRALAGLPEGPGSIVRRVIESFVRLEGWEDCQRCIARERCPIKFNAESLRDGVVADRLEQLLLIQHLRRQRRATLRDIRSALAYCVTSNRTCAEVHRVRREPRTPGSGRRHLYFETIFGGARENDSLLKEMGVLDPGRRSHPRVERFLQFHRALNRLAELKGYLPRVADWAVPEVAGPGEQKGSARWIRAMKRLWYFEGRPAKEDSGGARGEAGEREWELPEGATLLPYWYLEDFLRVIRGELGESEVRERLLRGITRSERVPPQGAREGLAVALAQNRDEELTVIKKFGAAEFRCDVKAAQGEYVERVPDTLELAHVSGLPVLRVGLDMFELLSRFAEGYTPDAREFEPYLIELAEFKAALLRQRVAEVLLLEGRSRLHRVAVEDHVICWKEEVPCD